jgi:CubicO group peptidase (beta-lactamase class C family)
MLVFALACSRPDETAVDTDVADTDTDDTDSAVETLDPEAVAAVLDATNGALRGSQASGAQVAIWLDGRVYYLGAVGFANPDGTRAIDEDTLFQIGSDTKKMTAIAVLQAVERGDLSLDDPLATAVPSLEFTGDAAPSSGITLHELLSHQSGLYDFTPWDDDPADSALAERAYGTFAAGEPAMAPSGVMWNYANPNFALAGLAAEVADGRPYADIVEQDVVAPLGLTRTFARRSEIDENAATGRGIRDFVPASEFDAFGDSTYSVGAVEPADQIDNAFLRPAGMVWSTASDMCRLAGFLVDGDPAVLRDDLREQIVSPQVLLYPSWDAESYGYGMFLLDRFSVGTSTYHATLWSHGGNTLTMTSLLYVLPEQRMAVCIQSNGYADDFSAGGIEALLQWGNLPAPVEKETPPPPLADLSKYAGAYADPTVGRIVIAQQDAGLTIAMPDLDARGYNIGTKLTPTYEDIFTFNINRSPYDLTYIDGYMRNRSFVGTPNASMVWLGAADSPGMGQPVIPEIPTSLAPLLRP